MEAVYGIHLGLVVSSDRDPEERNRVQVWIPYLTNTLYKSINAKLKDVTFKGPEDLNLIDPLILKTIQKTLPWAEYAAPMLGGSSGAFNTATGKTATNAGSTLQSEPISSPTTNPNSPNMDKGGNRQPTDIFDIAKTRQDIPYDGRTATKRYNNPGGAYPKATFVKLGMTGYGVIGGGHPIGNYPSVANGAAANMYQFRTMPVVGMTVGEARNYWVTGNKGGYMDLPGMNSNQVITYDLIENQDWLAGWMKSTAKAEGFGNISDQNLTDAFKILDGSSTFDPTKIASTSGKAPVQHLDNNADVGLFAGNIGVAGSAVGSFSTPNAGTKVWVFFLGGDIQRPVYFAQAPSPSDIAALNS